MSLIKLAAKKPSKEELEAYDDYRGFKRKMGTGVMATLGAGLGAGIGSDMYSHMYLKSNAFGIINDMLEGKDVSKVIRNKKLIGGVAGGAVGAALLGGSLYALQRAHDKKERQLYASGASRMNLNNY